MTYKEALAQLEKAKTFKEITTAIDLLLDIIDKEVEEKDND